MLLLWLAGGGAAAADRQHVIQLRHRTASEVHLLIQPALRSGDGVSGSGYRLRASESRRRETEAVIAAADVAPRRLTVTLRQTPARTEGRSRDRVGVAIDTESRGRIILPDDSSDDVVVGARGRDGLRYRGERRTSAAEGAHTQVLRVRDGSRAFIRIGQSAPVVERVLVLTRRRAGAVALGIRFEEFTTGFDLRPRVSGDTVQLEITPRLATRNRADRSFQFQELQTSVSARLGEWVDLGALIGQSSDVHRAILESATTRTGERATVALKVE